MLCLTPGLTGPGSYYAKQTRCSHVHTKSTYMELHWFGAPSSPFTAPNRAQHCVMRSLGEPLEIEHCRPVTLTYITHLLLDRLLQHLGATLSHTNDQVQICIVPEYIFDFPDCKEHLGCCVKFWNNFFQQTMMFTWTLIVLFHSSHFVMSEEVKHRCNYQHYTVHFISYWDT